MSHQAATGTLYGVGVGPGDPELLTLKAVRTIQSCAVVAYPANKDGYSQARTIAADFLQGQTEIPIHLPFTKERSATLLAYDAAAEKISALLQEGKDVAILCEGDPLLFGSFIYLQERLAAYPIKIVPGISSVMAAAAATRVPLARLDQSLRIIPATTAPHILEAALVGHDPVVILKPGKRRGMILHMLENSGRLQDAVYIENASRPEQRIITALSELDRTAPGPYFALLIVRGRSDE